MKLHKIVFMGLPALLLPVLVLLSSVPKAHADGASDITISVVQNENIMRYEADITFRSTTFYYDLISIAENVESGERYINSGVWREAGGEKTDSFSVTVKNRSNHSLTTETVLDTGDFVRCGAGVTLRGADSLTLPAVEKTTDGRTVVYEGVTEAVFGAFPRLDAYRGVKRITATVVFKKLS